MGKVYQEYLKARFDYWDKSKDFNFLIESLFDILDTQVKYDHHRRSFDND